MSTSVAMLKEFHGTRHFGNRENLLRQQAKAADLYRTLTAEEVDQLARFAIGGSENDTAVPRQEILLWLACLRPGSLVAFHDILVDHGRYYPAVIYHDAGSATAARVVNLLPGEDANNMLKALAWIGDAVVQDAFRRWRADPPGWADHLFVPPHRYAAEAAWELTPEGDRRDLFVRGCRPLVKPVEDPRTGVAQVVSDHEGACGWCGHRMTTLLDLNLSSSELGFLGLGGHRLRIATCLVCSCFGNLLTKIDLDGGSTWHAANRRPDYLPAPSAEWPLLPTGCLVLGGEERHWLESADWLVGGVRFSQIGGLPTWIQEARYPDCPECGRAMPFIAQLSNEDIEEYGEGIYYMFACTDCGVAATSYQQS